MEAVAGIFIIIATIIYALLSLWRGRSSGGIPDRSSRAYAREHFIEECALCDEDIYIWHGSFLHVSTDQPEASTPHGKPHRVMPWSVYEELRESLLADERSMMKGKRKPHAVQRDRDRDEVTLEGYCPGCLGTVLTIVRAGSWDRWKKEGEPFLDAFPDASVADRATIEVGWHAACYREWWGDIRRHEPFEDAA